jgi:hypothetical protein
MTAWSIGAAATENQANPPGIEKLVEWIPGDVIAAYSAAVLALQPDDGSKLEITPWWLLAGAIAFAALLTFLGAWARRDKIRKGQLLLRMVFAATAFAIWAFVVPGSWWHSLDWVADNEPVVPIAAGVIGVAFALFAEGAVLRVENVSLRRTRTSSGTPGTP